MSDEREEEAETTVIGELSELGSAIKPLLRRLPGARKAITFLTDGPGGIRNQGAESTPESLSYREPCGRSSTSGGRDGFAGSGHL